MKILIQHFIEVPVPGMFDPQIGMIHHKTRAVGARCYRGITGPRRQKKTSNAGKLIRYGKKLKWYYFGLRAPKRVLRKFSDVTYFDTFCDRNSIFYDFSFSWFTIIFANTQISCLRKNVKFFITPFGEVVEEWFHFWYSNFT